MDYRKALMYLWEQATITQYPSLSAAKHIYESVMYLY